MCGTSHGDLRCSPLRVTVLLDVVLALAERVPELDGLVVGREKIVRGILASAPFDLVDLLFDFEGLQVVEFRLMRLELSVELVLASFFLCQESAHGPVHSSRPAGSPTDSFLSKRTTLPPLSPVAR